MNRKQRNRGENAMNMSLLHVNRGDVVQLLPIKITDIDRDSFRGYFVGNVANTCNFSVGDIECILPRSPEPGDVITWGDGSCNATLVKLTDKEMCVQYEHGGLGITQLKYVGSLRIVKRAEK